MPRSTPLTRLNQDARVDAGWWPVGVLVDQGANVLVARQLGHADPSASLRNSTPTFDDRLDEAATRLDEAIAPWSECWAAVQSAPPPDLDPAGELVLLGAGPQSAI
jgi:hypothetical protein